jgi:ribosomal protein L21
MINEQSIYKFFPYNPHDLDALSNDYLWFSHYSDFNDPFEDLFIANALNVEISQYEEKKAIEFYKLLHQGEFPADQVEASILELCIKGELEEHYKNTITTTIEYAKKKFSKFVSDSKVCCFAQDRAFSEEPALQNKLMWSHYANGLRGFCVEYDRHKLMKELHKTLGYKPLYTTIEYGKLKKYQAEELLLNAVNNIKGSSSQVGIGSIATMKSDEWAYENEFRLVVENSSLIKINSEAIRSITMGDKMDDHKLNTLLSIIKSNERINCKINRAIIDTNSFEININPMPI